ncbi:50S ribosomal protein L3 [Haloglomus salinum]|uniref:50S ribosomal protein L3 n=1 Tax=Haloglomus salinum TaxID=2962673 RepID=UPI0020CA13FD|nr:50S ribosomal protein L3 [Haloglomus salinum]
MPQPSRPRKGSMGYSPRSRTDSEVPRISTWPADGDQAAIQGFAGYKAGMTHVVMINDEPDSPREGMEETVPVTVVETPPVRAAALRAYESTPYGQRPITEVWADAENRHDDLSRAVSAPDEMDDSDLQTALDEGRVDDVRLITHTVPGELPSVPKTTPDVMETRVGGPSVDARVEFAMDLLEEGGAHDVTDVFRAGEYADISGVTKGKGTQGPVKRWGVQKRKGKHARQGWRRRIGNLGPWNPSRVRSTVPQQGQMGYSQRTELNKRLLALDEGEMAPDGGFVNYGEVDGSYALVKGSVPGPNKRLLRLRPAVRATKQPPLDPEVRYVSTESNQG